MIVFGPFRPDIMGPGSNMAQVADGVSSRQTVVQGAYGPVKGIGYGPLASQVRPATAVALPTAPRGSITLKLRDGTSQAFFGTDATIQQLQADYSFTAIATGLNPTVGDDMSFAKFGDYLLNTNRTDGLKAYNLETPAGNNAVAGAPVARQLTVSNNVVFAFDCGGDNRRMQSSGLGDHTDWIGKGANGKTFEDGGSIVCGRDLKNGSLVVFQDLAMRLIQFGSAPDGSLYSISKITDGVGSGGERSVVAWDGVIYFLSADGGFFSFDQSNGIVPIGYGKIDDWFLGQLDLAYRLSVQGAVDPRHKTVWWRWKKLSTISTTVTEVMLGYCWGTGEWTTATVNTSSLTRIATPGYTLDGMDAFGPLDSITTPLDDPFWQGGQPVFAGLDANYKFCTYSGGAMAATLQTSVAANPVMGRIGWATPSCDSTNLTLQVGVTDDQDATPIWSSANSKGRAGAVPLRARGLNVAFRLNIPLNDTWTYANGIDNVQAAQGGSR
jgi:hypothetical protein